MKKEAYEFRRDIVSGALNPRSGKIVAEKILKYFEDKLKAKVQYSNYLYMYSYPYLRHLYFYGLGKPDREAETKEHDAKEPMPEDGESTAT